MSPSLWFKSPPDYENPQSVTSSGFGPNDYQVVSKLIPLVLMGQPNPLTTHC